MKKTLVALFLLHACNSLFGNVSLSGCNTVPGFPFEMCATGSLTFVSTDGTSNTYSVTVSATYGGEPSTARIDWAPTGGGGGGNAFNGGTAVLAIGTEYNVVLYHTHGGLHGMDSELYTPELPGGGEPTNCVMVPYDHWIDNRTGTAARHVQIAKRTGVGGTWEVVPGTFTTVPIGGYMHLVGNVELCDGDAMRLEQFNPEAGDGGAFEGLSGGDDPVTENQLPDPDPAPAPDEPVIDTTGLNPVPDPSPAFTTPDSTVETKYEAGNQLILKNIAESNQKSANNSEQIVKNGQYANNRLKSIDDNIGKMRRNSDEARALLSVEAEAYSNTKGTSVVVAAADAIKSEAETVIGSLTFGDDGTAASGPTSSGSFFVVEFGNIVFDLDPASSTLVSSGAAWVKTFIMWILLIMYAVWVVNELENKLTNLMIIPQAKGNPIVGGTGAQATAFGAALAITAAVFIALPAIWAIAAIPSIGVSVSDVVSGGQTILTTASGWAAGTVYLLYFFLPVQFIITLGIHVFVFKKASMVIYFGVAAFIKHIVP